MEEDKDMEMDKELAQFLEKSKSICHRFDLLLKTNGMVKTDLVRLRAKVKQVLEYNADLRGLLDDVNQTLKYAIETISVEDSESESEYSDLQPRFEFDADSDDA